MKKWLTICAVGIVLIGATYFVYNKQSMDMDNVTNQENGVTTDDAIGIDDTSSTIDENIPSEEDQGNINFDTDKNPEVTIDDSDITGDEQTAINIVKNDFGNIESVYFSYEGKNENGKHIVCVRKKSTTEAINWYYVDVNTNTFSKDGG